MNTIDNQIKVLQAFKEGKAVEVMCEDYTWKEIKEEVADFYPFNFATETYRVKPTFRKFNNVEEFWQEALKHQPFGWLKEKVTGNRYLINSFEGTYSVFKPTNENHTLAGYLKDFEFADGTPCGMLEEE